jgi:hypothetical protein
MRLWKENSKEENLKMKMIENTLRIFKQLGQLNVWWSIDFMKKLFLLINIFFLYGAHLNYEI